MGGIDARYIPLNKGPPNKMQIDSLQQYKTYEKVKCAHAQARSAVIQSFKVDPHNL